MRFALLVPPVGLRPPCATSRAKLAPTINGSRYRQGGPCSVPIGGPVWTPIDTQGLHQIVDRAGRDALDIGFLDHCRQRLLGHPARFEKAGEVAALAQPGNVQLNLASSGLPPELVEGHARGARCAGPGGQVTSHRIQRRSDYRPPSPSAARRQTRSSRAKYQLRGLFHQQSQVHHGIGHRGSFRQVRVLQPKPYPKTTVTTSHPQATPRPGTWRN